MIERFIEGKRMHDFPLRELSSEECKFIWCHEPAEEELEGWTEGMCQGHRDEYIRSWEERNKRSWVPETLGKKG